MRKAAGLEYEVAGDGDAVLLIHGGVFAGAFAPLMREPLLTDRYRLIRYHRRGHANSDGFTGPFSIEDQARDALGLLKHLAVERAHVVGHSYGGAVTVQLARSAPELVRSLVLIEPAIYHLEPRWLSAQSKTFAPLIELYGRADKTRVAEVMMRGAEGDDWKNGVESAFPGGVTQSVNDIGTMIEVELPAFFDWTFGAENAAEIAQPVLYVTGGERRQPVEKLKDLFRSLVPQTEEVEIADANHSLHHRRPTEVASAMRSFFERIPND